MSDIAELVQRLRVYSEDVAAFDLEIARTVREAADALEAQAKRIAQLVAWDRGFAKAIEMAAEILVFNYHGNTAMYEAIKALKPPQE